MTHTNERQKHMQTKEFERLKEWHLSKPDHPRRKRTPRQRMSDFYREVRDINWKASNSAPKGGSDE